MTSHYFHFTLGPVQGFVAQARRTRDFWAGSFILSWLSAVAMCAVRAQKGEILFPKPDENFLAWLGDKTAQKTGDAPHQGNIPNRFKAKVNPDFKPLKIKESVQIAWCELAELVLQDVSKSITDKNAFEKTAKIWNRQINHFWEISWALTDDPSASDLLDCRKNWRNHFAPDEDGVKCTVMEGWQELSGNQRPNKKTLQTFWQPLQNKFSHDLAKNDYGVYEHLCAIAFVKRRFSSHFKNLANKQIEMYGGWQLKGWDLKNIGIPSVSLMAAVPWLKAVIEKEEVTQLNDLIQLANQLGGGNQEIAIPFLKVALDQKPLVEMLKTSDGDVFFENALNNENKYPNLEQVKRMREMLNKIDIKPSPFYAILMMDGDSLGEKMSDVDNQKAISKALSHFTQAVPEKVEAHNGFLIYVGGDDVLALLPVEDALQCAADVRHIYQEAFKDKGPELEKSTISAAIEFVHTHTPLTTILKDAHDLLETVAKDGCDRNAVAVRVWKRGGKALEWAMKWDDALTWDETLKCQQFEIKRISKQFQDQEGGEAAFSNRFFYHIRERFELLNGEDHILSSDEECTLLATDYLNSGVNKTRIKEKQLDLAKAEAEIRPLLKQCQAKEVLKADGALLIRFLAQEGRKYQ
ncbi:MAG: type III-B CRISPR-associated protein Cas10/Cmr2 [Candidatus Parabeggiatoa sp.]|nr:type III-B CRISPR-associated protein Cas10/Cmr2 [Candidatus Parabeggiatoa sp.]